MSDAEKPNDNPKTDWSFIDKTRRPAKRLNDSAPESQASDLVATVAPAVLGKRAAAPAPTFGASRGFLMEFRANRMGRKATLEALQHQYNSALDIYKHHLRNVVTGQNARDDIDYAAYQKQLDQEYLEVLAELGLRNKDVRERTLLELTDRTAARLQEVHEKNWPQSLKDSVIDELIALRQRFSDDMMKELGRP